MSGSRGSSEGGCAIARHGRNARRHAFWMYATIATPQRKSHTRSHTARATSHEPHRALWGESALGGPAWGGGSSGGETRVRPGGGTLVWGEQPRKASGGRPSG